MAITYYTFQGTHVGLEYLLTKGQDAKMIDLILEVLNPRQSLIGKDFDSFSVAEEFDFYIDAKFIPYIDKAEVLMINQLLASFSEADIQVRFDANELNNNGI